MPKGIPLTEEATATRRRGIVEAAARLFVTKGFQSTSMREVAEAIGVGKSTLYDYFQTKEQILFAAVDKAVGDMNEKAIAIAALPLPPAERIRRIIQTQVDLMLDDDSLLLHLIGQATQQATPTPDTREFFALASKRGTYQDVISGIIKEGIDQGCFRRVDSLVAARMLLNAMPAAFYTARPTGTVPEMMDEIVGIFVRGISK